MEDIGVSSEDLDIFIDWSSQISPLFASPENIAIGLDVYC